MGSNNYQRFVKPPIDAQVRSTGAAVAVDRGLARGIVFGFAMSAPIWASLFYIAFG